jgi:hypothetical protein
LKLREEQSLKVDNRVLKRIFRPKRDEVIKGRIVTHIKLAHVTGAYLYIYYIYLLFIFYLTAVSSSHYKTSSGRIISKQLIAKNGEGSVRGIILGTVQEFLWSG